MFGVLVAGRLVQTNAQQVSATNLVFPLDNATEIQTICVFLTGSQPLPPGAASIIWLGWPPFNSWKYLGYLTNERPSAVFKLTQVFLNPHHEILTFLRQKKSNKIKQLLSSGNSNIMRFV